MKIQITFKSGAQVTADVEEFTTGRSPMHGGLTKLDWTTPDAWAFKLHWLDLGEVVAVVAIGTPTGDRP